MLHRRLGQLDKLTGLHLDGVSAAYRSGMPMKAAPRCRAIRETADPLMRHHHCVELRPGLRVDDGLLRDFAARHGVRKLALFGSVLRDDFGPDSDVDVLVEFHPDRTPGLLHLAQMELELEDALGRRVELRTIEDLSGHFRDEVVAHALPLYAA